MSQTDEYKNASDQAFKEWESESPDYRFECEVFEGGFSKAWNRQQSRIAQLEADLAEANDYIDKINTIYQKDEIFVVKNGEGFYTDKFDSVIMTNVVAIKEQGK